MAAGRSFPNTWEQKENHNEFQPGMTQDLEASLLASPEPSAPNSDGDIESLDLAAIPTLAEIEAVLKSLRYADRYATYSLTLSLLACVGLGITGWMNYIERKKTEDTISSTSDSYNESCWPYSAMHHRNGLLCDSDISWTRNQDYCENLKTQYCEALLQADPAISTKHPLDLALLILMSIQILSVILYKALQAKNSEKLQADLVSKGADKFNIDLTQPFSELQTDFRNRKSLMVERQKSEKAGNIEEISQLINFLKKVKSGTTFSRKKELAKYKPENLPTQLALRNAIKFNVDLNLPLEELISALQEKKKFIKNGGTLTPVPSAPLPNLREEDTLSAASRLARTNNSLYAPPRSQSPESAEGRPHMSQVEGSVPLPPAYNPYR